MIPDPLDNHSTGPLLTSLKSQFSSVNDSKKKVRETDNLLSRSDIFFKKNSLSICSNSGQFADLLFLSYKNNITECMQF